jgi:hypothetical protein
VLSLLLQYASSGCSCDCSFGEEFIFPNKQAHFSTCEGFFSYLELSIYIGQIPVVQYLSNFEGILKMIPFSRMYLGTRKHISIESAEQVSVLENFFLRCCRCSKQIKPRFL